MKNAIRAATALLLAVAFFFLGGCSPRNYLLEPVVSYEPQPRQIKLTPTAFPPLTEEELRQEWGRELLIANTFAKDFDLYRAITCYKRALILIPTSEEARIQQIEYGIFLANYLGRRYQEAVCAFENSSLPQITGKFPAGRELLLALFDSYSATEQYEKAEKLFCFIERLDQGMADDLQLSTYLQAAQIDLSYEAVSNYPKGNIVIKALDEFNCCRLSVHKAQTLNAVLPGLGYLYVGQNKAAVTSFVINGLFSWAAYKFFDRGYIAAGLITSSLEVGWYVGGINGAGLAAKEFNESLYNYKIKEAMIKAHLFPVLMFQTAF